MKRLLLALGLTSCTMYLPSPTAGSVTTLDVQLLSPSPGSPAAPNTIKDATVTIDARQDDGTDLPVDLSVDIYLSYGGVLAGAPVDCGVTTNAPIETITLTNGHIENHQLTLPDAFGSSAIWAVERVSQVVGASVPIYFPNPTIPQIQTPANPAAANATFCSGFDGKFIQVDHATGSGEMIIDSVFNGAVVAVDTGANDTGYNAMYLFTFGAPATDVVKGRKISLFTGNISKFNGFTELNFPVITTDDTVDPDITKLPAPVMLTQPDISNVQKLNSLDARTVTIAGTICQMLPPNPTNDATIQKTIDSWNKYDTFVLGTAALGSGGCDSFTEFSVELPGKVVGGFDPTQLVGKTATITGMLKNASGQNAYTDASGVNISCDDQNPCASGTCTNGVCYKGAYNFWTVTVRDQNDIVTP